MLCFPNLAKASFSDNVQIVEHHLLNLGNLYRLMMSILEQFLLFFDQILTELLILWLLFLICEMLGIFGFESSFLLGIHHEVIS